LDGPESKSEHHLVMPECQRDLSREREIKRESLVFAVFGSGLRLIFTGPIWAGIFDPLNTFQGGLLEENVAFTIGGILSPSRLKKTGESLAV